MTQKEKVVFPADVFDALELSALVHGGVGSGCFGEEEITDDWSGAGRVVIPTCIMGHAMFLDGTNPHVMAGEVERAILHAFQADLIASPYTAYESREGSVAVYDVNDDAVDAVICSLDSEKDRIPWKQWCKRVGVVRGE